MVEVVEVEMAALFVLRLALDARLGPKLPWRVEDGVVLTDDSGNPIATFRDPRTAHLVAGMMTGAAHVSTTLYKVARLLVESGMHGWGSPPGKRLQNIMSKLMKMDVDGKLPKIE